MKTRLCSQIWNLVEQNSGKHWPQLTAGDPTEIFVDVQDTGGFRVPSNLTKPLIAIGTESQMGRFRNTLIRQLLPNDGYAFEDADFWRGHSPWMVDLMEQFLPATGTRPCLAWVTPAMTLIGRSLLSDQLRTEDSILREYVLPQRVPNLTLEVGGETLHLTLSQSIFSVPQALDDPPSLHVICRARQIVDTVGRPVEESLTEYLVFLAHPHVHAQQISRCHTPANAQFYETDVDTFAGGWLSTPHLTLVKVVPIGKSKQYAWARYLAFRFHRQHSRVTSFIFGEDDFGGFVGQHTALQRLLNRAILGTDSIG